MIQKKICMVGVFGTGKTSLVQRYVFSLFLAKYHSTVGVKIDRKAVMVDGAEVNLLLWDVAGRDTHEDIPASYLRGAHGTLYVVDGTRRETFDQLDELRDIVRSAAGDIPSLVALNKSDLTDEWKLTAADEKSLSARGYHGLRTSAKDGRGVEEAFSWIAKASLKSASDAR